MKLSIHTPIRTPRSALYLAMAVALSPALAHAQLDEVIVTAQKQEQLMQDVPVAITALTADTLQDLRITNFGEVGQTIPNLNVQSQFGSASAPQFYMRGISTGSLSFQTDSGIGLYIDGVYLGRAAGTAFDLADVDRIEVLRGPQGSVFGRNSTGGAINLITAEPTGEFGGRVEVGFGNYDERRQRVTVNLPEVAGLAARLTVLHSEHGGYVDNDAAGHRYQFVGPFGNSHSASELGMENTDAVALALSYTGIDRLKVDYRFDYTDKVATQLGAQLLGFVNGGNAADYASRGGPTPNLHRQDRLSLDFSGASKLRVEGHSLTAEYELTDNLSVKNILSYREFHENVGLNDIDGGALSIGGVPFQYISSNQVRKQSQWSDEIQFIGSTDSVDWVGGLFWFEEKGHDNNPVFLSTLFPEGQVYNPGTTNGSILAPYGVTDYTAGAHSKVENESKAAYVHATWHISDRWDLAGGLRYTEDDRYEKVIRAASLTNATFSDSFNNTDWDVSLTYFVNDNTSVYGKVSTGYISGGTIGGVSFEPEEVLSYELGAKSELFDKRLRVNAAMFRSERKHQQFLTFSGATGTSVVDGGDSEQQGFEVEVVAAPIDGLTLTANYGYLDVDLDDAAPGNRPLRSLAAQNNAYLAAQYDFAAFANGAYVTARLDGSWTDDRYGLGCIAGETPSARGCVNSGAPADVALDDSVVMKANWQVGARLALTDIPLTGDMKGRVSLWGRNLLDSDELEFTREINGNVIGTFQIPRTYGVDFSVDF